MAGTQAKDSTIHEWVQLSATDNGNITIFEIPTTRIERYMKGHCVAGLPLFPASVYLEFVITGVILTTKHLAKYYDDLHVALQQIHFTKTLTSSGLSQSESQTLHVHGEYGLQSASDLTDKLTEKKFAYPGQF